VQPIEYVIFDWAGTLTPWHVLDQGAAWAAAVGEGAAADRLRSAEESVWIRSRDEHRSATLAEVERLAGVTLSGSDWDRYFDWWEEHTVTDPAAGPLFGELAGRGLRVGVLSNTIWPRERHEQIFRRDGVLHLLDGAVYSSEIAWTKPHPGAFRAALEAVGGVDPASAVFVGDRLFDDIHGAKSAGMRAVLVPHSVIPAWQTTGVEGRPDAVIDSLDDLLVHVDEWLDLISQERS
jgi:putative hydrolase of the HAD superfamily